MKRLNILVFILMMSCWLLAGCVRKPADKVCVPFTLDHNRMLVKAEIEKPDSSWREIVLWVDTGNPDFFVSEALATDLGIDLSNAADKVKNGALEMSTPPDIRIGGMELDLSAAQSKVILQPKWLFSTMHNDANLPSTVLRQYQVVFNYPKRMLTLAKPGRLPHRGKKSTALIHPQTSIVQIEADIYGDSLSFALDNGASYSFASAALLTKIQEHQPACPKMRGALGCANIWGWWPEEESWEILRIPEMRWGSITLTNLGLVGLPESFPLPEWYSRKTARPVAGLLGPNALMAFRIEIDYQNNAVYFEKESADIENDMDIVGLTLRPEADGRYSVLGVAEVKGHPAVDEIRPGDILVQVDDTIVQNATMGTVTDALRGKPGETRRLLMERNGKTYIVNAQVQRFL